MIKSGHISISQKSIVLLAAPVLIFLYVAIRAALIDITHDEAYSFYNMKKFWYAEALCTGNTHWLNSMAIKTAILFNLEHVLFIRWLSVVSAFVICLLVYRWMKNETITANRFMIMGVLLCNPYMLDYLTIARGYAAGMMCEFLALFLFVKSDEQKEGGFKFLSLVVAGLSALANFSYIYFFFCFCLVYFLKMYLPKKRLYSNAGFYRDLLFAFAIAAVVARSFLFITRCSNDVVGAGTDNIQEFFHVFADSFIYMKWNISFNCLTVLGVIVFAIPLVSSVYGVVYRRINPLYFYSSLLFLLIVFVILLNHLVFHLVYPYYRSAVFMFPVSAVSTVCFILELGSKLKWVSYLAGFLLCVNFCLSANFKWVFDFRIQANLSESMRFAESLYAKRVGLSPELYGGYRNYHQMTWKYYFNFFGETLNTNLPKGKSKDPEFLSRFDHLILFPPYDLSFYRNNPVKLKGLKLYPETGTLVVKVIN